MNTDKLDIPKRRRSSATSAEAREGKKPRKPNPMEYFLWEAIRGHELCGNLTEIFEEVLESGCNLSGPESSRDFAFWCQAFITIYKEEQIAPDEYISAIRCKKNTECLAIFKEHAVKAFRKKEHRQQDQVEQRRLFSEEFKL